MKQKIIFKKTEKNLKEIYILLLKKNIYYLIIIDIFLEIKDVVL